MTARSAHGRAVAVALIEIRCRKRFRILKIPAAAVRSDPGPVSPLDGEASIFLDASESQIPTTHIRRLVRRCVTAEGRSEDEQSRALVRLTVGFWGDGDIDVESASQSSVRRHLHTLPDLPRDAVTKTGVDDALVTPHFADGHVVHAAGGTQREGHSATAGSGDPRTFVETDRSNLSSHGVFVEGERSLNTPVRRVLVCCQDPNGFATRRGNPQSADDRRNALGCRRPAVQRKHAFRGRRTPIAGRNEGDDHRNGIFQRGKVVAVLHVEPAKDAFGLQRIEGRRHGRGPRASCAGERRQTQ